MSDNNFNIKFDIKLSGKEGAAAAKRMFATIALFWLPNLIFVIWTLVKMLSSAFTPLNFLLFLISVVAGVAFSFSAFFMAYRYIFISALKSAHPHPEMKPFLKEICDLLAQKYAADPDFGKKVENFLDYETLYDNGSGKQRPWFAKFILKHIPFVEFVRNISVDAKKNDKAAISASIYSQANDYMVNDLFKNNSMRWFLYLFPANMIVQLLCIAFMK